MREKRPPFCWAGFLSLDDLIMGCSHSVEARGDHRADTPSPPSASVDSERLAARVLQVQIPPNLRPACLLPTEFV
jgi:hypothetical protein